MVPASRNLTQAPRGITARRAIGASLLGLLYVAIGTLAAHPIMEGRASMVFLTTLSLFAWIAALLAGAVILGRWAGATYAVIITSSPTIVLFALGVHSESALAWVAISALVSFFFGGVTGSLADSYREARLRTAELAAKNADLERATATVAQRESMFREFADRIEHGVWMSPNARAEDVQLPAYHNPALRTIIGSEDPLMDWRERVHPDDLARVEASTAALRRGAPQDIEYRVVDASGRQVRYVRAKSFPVHATNGAIETLVGIVEDVTEAREREANRELIERRERLSALGNLVAGVAHEVNNPLTYLMGNMQLAQAELARSAPNAPNAEGIERAQRLIRTSVEGGERIARIVRALRAVTRTSGEGTREPVRLNAIATSIHDLMRTSIPASLTLELHTSPDDPEVEGNAGELAQVILNLATNAVQAVGQRPGSVAIEVRCDDEHATLTVRDDGPGLTPEAHARLFTPFFTTKAEGTGLGLSIAHAIVHGHGGEIRVNNAPGEGAVFSVRLPLRAVYPMKVIG